MKITDLTPEPELLRELGRRAAQLRKQRGYSQDELAAEAGIGVATLRRLEAGQDARFGTWARLLRALERTAAIEALLPDALRSPMAEVLGSGQRRSRAVTHERVPWGDGG